MVALLAALLLAGCAGGEDGPATVPLTQPPSWRALLISGDDSIAAFDNAVLALDARLSQLDVPPQRVRLVTARKLRDGPATVAGIDQAASKLRPQGADGCIAFLTAHGAKDYGLSLPAGNDYLTPRRLDRILTETCGGRPTLVVVSGCYTGIFTDAAMRRPNRAILTAANASRPSFGAGNVYTVFDACLLGAFLPRRPIADFAAGVKDCVAAEETKLDVRASEPQFWSGAQVAGLRLPG
jgi:hypothetical protein